MNGHDVCLSATIRTAPARVLFREETRGKGSRFCTARNGVLEVRGSSSRSNTAKIGASLEEDI